MTSSKLSAPTIASRRIPLKLQLDAELKNSHTIQWQTDKLDSPLVIRYKDKDVKTEIKRWAKAITTVTGQKVEQSSKTTYVRINLVAKDVTMYASIYGTATVMFQGKGYEQWLKEHVRELILEYHATQQQSKLNHDCNICGEKDTYDMRLCEDCQKWIHKDCDIDNVIEAEVTKSRYRCPSCSKPENPDVNTNADTRTNTRKSRKQTKHVSPKTTTSDKLLTPSNVRSDSLVITEKPATLNNAANSCISSIPHSESPAKILDEQIDNSNGTLDKTFTKETDDKNQTFVVNTPETVDSYNSEDDKEEDEEDSGKNIDEEWLDDDNFLDDNLSLLHDGEESSESHLFQAKGKDHFTADIYSPQQEVEESHDYTIQAEDLLKKKTVSPITVIDEAKDDEEEIQSKSSEIQASENPVKITTTPPNDDEDDDDETFFDTSTNAETLLAITQAAEKDNMIQTSEAGETNDDEAYLSLEDSEKVKYLENQMKNLSQQLIVKQTRIGELEMKLNLKIIEHQDTSDEYKKLQVQVEEMKNTNSNESESETSNSEEYTRELQIIKLQNLINDDITLKLNEENKTLDSQLREVNNKLVNMEKENRELKSKMESLNDEVSVIYQENITPPTGIPRGLPDNRGNLCFVISSIHTLSRTLQLDNLKVLCPGRFTSLLMKTKDLLDGKEVDESILMEEIWHMIVEFWPDYIKLDSKGKKTATAIQHDAAEFMMRYINKLEEECEESLTNIQTIVHSVTECTNKKCKVKSKTNSVTESIIRTSAIPNETELSLQQVIDSFTPQLGTRYETVCNTCKGVAKETSSLLMPPPSVIIHVDRVVEYEVKATINIHTNQTVNIPVYNSAERHQYHISDVIVHKGSQAKNGHYVTNHYNQESNQWEQLDNAKCEILDDEEARKLNAQGVIYVLKESKDVPQTPTHLVIREGNTVTYYKEGIDEEQLNEENKISRSYTPEPIQSKKKKSICKYFAEGICHFGPKCLYEHSIPPKVERRHNHVQQSQTKPICPKYKFGRCNDYDTCKEIYHHPRRCRDLSTFGECPYGNRCQFFHPKICQQSVENRECSNPKCSYYHLRLIEKPSAESSRNILYSKPKEISRKTSDWNETRQKRTTDAGIQRQAKDNSTAPTKGNNDDHILLEQFREMSKTVENLQSLMKSHLTIDQPPSNHHTQEHQPPSNHYTQEHHHSETQMPQNQPTPSSYTPAHYPTETLMIQNQPPPNFYTQAHCPSESQMTLNQCPPNQALTLDPIHQFSTQEHYLAHQLQQIQHMYHPVHQHQTAV